MEAKNKKYNIMIGQVIDLKNKKGISDLKIEAWDKDRIFDGSLGSEVTDKSGHFQFEFTEDYLTKTFGDKRPNIYFKILDANKLLKSTEHDFSYNIEKGEQGIVIKLDYYALVNDISINVDIFRIKTGETEKIDEKTRKYIDAKLNAHLTEHITNRFANPSEELKSGIGSLSLKYEDIKDESIKTVINKHVLPALKTEPSLKEELKDIDTERVGGDTTKIKDLLHLDQSIKDNPILSKETRRTKTLELANIAKIDSATAGRLADKDIVLEYAGDVVWANLVQEGVINETQLKDFQLCVELAKLTGDNFKFIKKLKTDDFSSIKDFIVRDKKDWLDVLRTSEVETPEGETLEEYADNIVFNIEHTYPSQFFMQRIAVKDKKEKLRLVGNIQPLFKNNKTVFGNGAVKRINWEGIDPADQKTIEESLTDLNGLANTYKYLGVVDILNAPDIDAVEKQQVITREIGKLKTFYQNNPDIDLRFVSFFKKTSSSGNNGQANLIWDNISEEDQPKVRKQLMSYQRAMNLAMGYDASEALLANGFDSAFAITNVTKSEFTKDSGLTAYMAEIAYENANQLSMKTSSDWGMFHDASKGHFADTNVGNNSPDLVNELRDIDGYDDLFGVQDYCETEHCRSIFSPAAYFVDLMLFIETYVSKPVFINDDMENHPIYLKNRRSDLWELPLTCENTNNMIPYLEIINEILERYLNSLSDISDIYNTLRESRSSFNQPFNLPLEELRIYMRHFDLTLSDIYKLLFVEGTDLQEIAITRERLKLSKEEFYMVINADSDDVLSFYGDTGVEELKDVQDFLKCTGITREELDQLIELDFIDNDDEITITRVEGDDIQNYKEIIENLSEDNLDRIHRFIRIWRKLPWTLQELDLVLKHLQEAALTDTLDQDAVIHIADLVEIQDALRVSAEELCALFYDIPDITVNEDQPSLFDRLFDSDSMFEVGHSSIPFHHPSFNDLLEEEELPDANTPYLLAGLGISETDLLHLLEFLRDGMPMDVDGNPELNHQTLSVLYRHTKLAKALKLSIEDFLHAVVLSQESPDSYISTIEDVKQLITFTEWLKTTPFSVGELWFILRGEESSRATYTIAPEQIAALVQKIQEDKALIFSDSILSEIDGVSEDDSKSLIEQLETDGFIAADTVENQYNLSVSYRLDHDFRDAFDAMDASEELRLVEACGKLRLKEDEIRVILNGYHHKTVLSSYLIDLFNVTQEFLDAVSLFIETDLADDRFFTALNTAITDGVTDTPDDLAILAAFVKKMERLQLLFEKSKLNEGSLRFITDNYSDIFDISDILHLTLKDIRFINIYKSLLVLQEESETVFDQLLTSYRLSIDSAAEEVFADEEVTELAKLIGCDSSLVQSLLDSSLELPVNALKAMEHLIACLDVCNTMGINGRSLNQLASTSSGNYNKLKAARDTVLGAFKAKYDDEHQRQDLITPFENEINTKKRDALCDYILMRNELKFEDMNDLYSFFLIDVEMSGVVKISKVKAGISSLQLYIHRCLMNLEQSQTEDNELNIRFKIDKKDWQQFEKEWEWRQNYRVWEANRKVFLYPENWIEPELRDNKTPIFKELEDDLLQQKITKESAENAYKKYLTQFAEVAKLKIVGSYYHRDSDRFPDPIKGTLYLFGRTLVDPPQYYYRKYIDNTVWTPWEKIELGIDASHVSAIIHLGKLYLFWVEVITRERSSGGGEDVEREGYAYEINLQYSYLNESGKWIPPQRLKGLIEYGEETAEERGLFDPVLDIDPESHVYRKDFLKWAFEKIPAYDKSYPSLKEDKINITYYRPIINRSPSKYISHRRLLLYEKILSEGDYSPLALEVPIVKLFWTTNAALVLSNNTHEFEADLDNNLRLIIMSDFTPITGEFTPEEYDPSMTIVHNKFGDFIVQLSEQQQFWIRSAEDGFITRKMITSMGLSSFIINIYSKRELIRLTTSLPDDLGNILYDEGLDAFLSLVTQKENKEKKLGIDFIAPSELLPPLDNPDHIDFRGAYGIYYRELFFHIPFLIATHLNANQKFEEAKYWYEKIFNPTASEKPEPDKPTDRNWRYIEFRDQNIKKLKEILTNDDAIELYKADPFSPHAIARLRINAYQKAIVMKYIDNLLDWGDHLFAQDTYESINEATMLYIMAADILGKRPVKLGKCELTGDMQRTYPQIRRGIDDGSEFLITLENWALTIYVEVYYARCMAAIGLEV